MFLQKCELNKSRHKARSVSLLISSSWLMSVLENSSTERLDPWKAFTCDLMSQGSGTIQCVNFPHNSFDFTSSFLLFKDACTDQNCS